MSSLCTCLVYGGCFPKPSVSPATNKTVLPATIIKADTLHNTLHLSGSTRVMFRNFVNRRTACFASEDSDAEVTGAKPVELPIIKRSTIVIDEDILVPIAGSTLGGIIYSTWRHPDALISNIIAAVAGSLIAIGILSILEYKKEEKARVMRLIGVSVYDVDVSEPLFTGLLTAGELEELAGMGDVETTATRLLNKLGITGLPMKIVVKSPRVESLPLLVGTKFPPGLWDICITTQVWVTKPSLVTQT